jgi:hypothetical protein
MHRQAAHAADPHVCPHSMPGAPRSAQLVANTPLTRLAAFAADPTHARTPVCTQTISPPEASGDAHYLQSAIKANSDNLKAYWRGTKAALGLGMPDIAIKIATKVGPLLPRSLLPQWAAARVGPC